jgi:glycerol-3-phosphate O-acyltransferase
MRVGLAIPHIAAGDNLLLAAVGRLLRGSGAFFIQRQGTDDLYNAVLDDYLSAIMKRGYNVEFFIEGGDKKCYYYVLLLCIVSSPEFFIQGAFS